MVLHLGRVSKKTTIIPLLLFLTVSLILVVPPTITKKPTMTQTDQTYQPIKITKRAVGDILWNKTFGGVNSDFGICIKQTSDGGYIILAGTFSFGAGDLDAWLIKIDTNGNLLWNKTYGGTEDDDAWCIKQTSDGDYIFTGKIDADGNDVCDLWLVKTYENGTIEWNKVYNRTTWDQGSCVEQTSDGGFIITGWTDSNTTYYYSDVWLIKTNQNGEEIWNKTYGGSDDDSGRCVLQTSDGGYIIVGQTDSYGPGPRGVLMIKTNSTGGLEWNKTYGGLGEDIGWRVLQTSDGGYIILSSTESYGFGHEESSDVWLIKTDQNGNHQWNKTYGTTEDESGYGIAQTSNNGYIITGRTYFNRLISKSDIFLIKTDQNGNEIWNTALGGSENDYGGCVEQTTDGGYIIIGTTFSFGNNGDVWLIKVSGDEETPLVPEFPENRTIIMFLLVILSIPALVFLTLILKKKKLSLENPHYTK